MVDLRVDVIGTARHNQDGLTAGTSVSNIPRTLGTQLLLVYVIGAVGGFGGGHRLPVRDGEGLLHVFGHVLFKVVRTMETHIGV